MQEHTRCIVICGLAQATARSAEHAIWSVLKDFHKGHEYAGLNLERDNLEEGELLPFLTNDDPPKCWLGLSSSSAFNLGCVLLRQVHKRWAEGDQSLAWTQAQCVCATVDLAHL